MTDNTGDEKQVSKTVAVTNGKLLDVKTEILSIVTSVMTSFFSRKLLLNETSNKILTSSLFALALGGVSYISTKNPIGYISSSISKFVIGTNVKKVIQNKKIINEVIRYMTRFDRVMDIPMKQAMTEKLNTWINFYDDTEKVIGRIKFSIIEGQSQITIICDSLKNKKTIERYLGIIHQRLMEIELENIMEKKDAGTLKLFNVTQCGGRKITEMMYKNDIITPILLETIFMKTIFHKDIEFLWTQIKNIHFNPEKLWRHGIAPRMNLLLHGPPGTGKSTFAYRVAMATGRHIINIKLSDYTREQMIQIFKSPDIHDEKYYAKDVVFILDEFDLDLERILMKSACKQKHLKKIDSIVDKFFDGMASNMITSKEKPISKTKRVCKTAPIEIEKSCDAHQIEIGLAHTEKQDPDDETQTKSIKTDVSEKKKENIQDVITSTSEILKEIDKFESYVSAMNSTYEKLDDNKSNIITMEDLLTIFQGAVPNEGCIIIAMTNKFEEMRKKCPALFRPGRLTPVYFGYFDMKILNNVSMHYFNKEIMYDCPNETELNIPPSQVMEIVAGSLLQENDNYNYFIKKLQCVLPSTINIHAICDNTSEPFPNIDCNFSLFKKGDTREEILLISDCETGIIKKKKPLVEFEAVVHEVTEKNGTTNYYLCNDYPENKDFRQYCSKLIIQKPECFNCDSCGLKMKTFLIPNEKYSASEKTSVDDTNPNLMRITFTDI